MSLRFSHVFRLPRQGREKRLSYGVVNANPFCVYYNQIVLRGRKRPEGIFPRKRYGGKYT